MKYEWKSHGMGSVSAQVAGEEIARLEIANDGALLPDTIVRAAKAKRSPIHGCFVWDDTKAAHLYRERQAGEIVRRLVVVYEDDGKDETVRAFVSIQNDEGDRYYTSTARILDDEDLLNNVRAQILVDLFVLKKKYKQFKDDRLAVIWAAVDEFAKV